MQNESVFYQCDPERIPENDMDTKDYNEGCNVAWPFSCIHRQIWHNISDGKEWNIKQIKYCTEYWIYDINVPCFRAFVIQANVYYFDINEQPIGKCDRLNYYVDNVTD